MRKPLLSVLGVAFMVLCAFVSVKPGPAAASYSPPNILCWFAQNPNFTSIQQYVCPPTSANPTSFSGGTSGFNAYAFEDAIGVNTHFIDAEYGNYAYTLSLLQAMNMHHIRDGLSTLSNGYVQSTLNSLAAVGIHASLTVSNNQSASSITSYLALVNSGVADTIEDPNELDICCGDGNWVADDQNETKNVVWPFVQANYPSMTVIGPSTGASSYQPLGDLSAYETYGNMHDYEGGFLPENTGWGGPLYCGLNYASIPYNICNARQATFSKPIAATEFGYEDAVGITNQVPDGAQGTFLIRQLFQHALLGVPRSYIYELIDTDGQTYGIVPNVHAQRPAFSEIAGLMQVLKDNTPRFSSCAVPAYTNTAGVSSFGICKSNGEYDLVLWQPAVTYDTNAKVFPTIPTINASVAYSAGFSPSSITEWSYNFAGTWSNNASVSPASVPVTDRPSVLVFNGAASPTPLPVLPTPIP